MKPLLRFDRLSCRRGGRMLFENLDLAVGPGEALQVTGPNGCGKSSLLRVAAGLLRPHSGNIEAAPLALSDDHLALDREVSLGRALGFWSSMAGTRDNLEGALRDLDLLHLVNVPVRFLSSGQQKRATLARVAASGAPLWLLDEPLNALDSDGGERLSKVIARHLRGGGAAVAASHVTLAGNWRTLELRQ